MSNSSGEEESSSSMQSGSTIKNGELTADDVAQHDTPDDCWTIINGGVYEITDYIKQHPGGSVITQACGKDGSRLFNTQDGEGSHSPTAEALLASFKIGTLKD